MSLADGGVIRGSDHSISLSTGTISGASVEGNKMLTAVLPSQTSRDAADTVRYLFECIVRNLNGVNRVPSLCSRAACVGGGGKAIGLGTLPFVLDCNPARVEVEAAGG